MSCLLLTPVVRTGHSTSVRGETVERSKVDDRTLAAWHELRVVGSEVSGDDSYPVDMSTHSPAVDDHGGDVRVL
jgi:hypothetical protein